MLNFSTFCLFSCCKHPSSLPDRFGATVAGLAADCVTGARVGGHDPKVNPEQIAPDLHLQATAAADGLSGTGSWMMVESLQQALAGADAFLILTEWQQYRALDWAYLDAPMLPTACVFDERSVADAGQVKSACLNFWRVGDGDSRR